MSRTQQYGIRILPALSLAAVLAIGPSAARGDVTYTLQFDPASSAEAQQVANSIAEAVPIINHYGSFNKHWYVYHNPGVPTAEANYDGYMAYGGTRNTRVVFHEGAHTFGMGTTTAYANLISSGVWGGQYGNQAQLDTYNTYSNGLQGDGHAIWPGGFNFDGEDGYLERIWMLRVMAGIRADMGILSYTREADHEVVNVGETAEFTVESPVAGSYQWYKGGTTLSDGGDISGATSPTLHIANAEAADAGSYRCAATGAGETLNSRSRQLWVLPTPELLQLDLDGNVSDSVNTNGGSAFGSPAYSTGIIGQAIELDGTDDYIELPASVGKIKAFTVATWVRWDGGSNWQRIFDFGTGTDQNIFLTPKSGSGTLRLAFKDRIHGLNGEHVIDTTVLPTAQWVHLAAVLNGDYATLYVNGKAEGSSVGIRTFLCNFLPTQNYIGKSQWPDALFDGRMDDFRIYSRALSGSEIWNLWGQSANTAPEFIPNVVLLPAAVTGEAYTAPSLTNETYDAEGDTLAFTKIDGPAWLGVAADGTLSGTPGLGDDGLNRFVFRVEDPSGASSDVVGELPVELAPVDYTTGPIAHWDFADAGAVDAAYLPGNGDRADLDGDGGMDADDFRIGSTDLSGNGNHLTAWTSTWMKWSADSLDGDFSMVNVGDYPAAGTDSTYNPHITGIDAERVMPSQWTVEAIFKANAMSGTQTMVGRDGRNVGGSGGDAAAFYLQTRGSELRVVYIDVEGARHDLPVSAGLVANTWYTAAGVSDGATLRLYLDGAEIGSLDLTTTGTDTALGLGDGLWSVGRGMWAGGHTDRFFGKIDAVAISGVALAPGSFVLAGDAWPSGYSFYAADHGIPGAPFDDDANDNGVPNGMEYYLGWNPTNPVTTNQVLTLSSDYLSVAHPFNPAASDVTGIVEWTADLTTNTWSSAGATYVTNTMPDEIIATVAEQTTNQLFIRLSVEE